MAQSCVEAIVTAAGSRGGRRRGRRGRVAMAYPNEEGETEGLNSPKMVYYSMLK